MRLLYILLLVSFSASATHWEVKGRRFFAPDHLYNASTALLQQSSQKIAEHLELLHDTHFSEVPDQVVVSYETTMGVDALYFPPGLYNGASRPFVGESVIVINPRMVTNNQLWRLLGHEYFHSIHQHFVPTEADWVREGLAQKFEFDVYGGITQTNLRTAIKESYHALEENFDPADPSAERYGNTFLFFHHLEETCGIDQVWRQFLSLPRGTLPGRSALDVVLKRVRSPSPDCQDARSIMGSFVLAKLVNQRHAGSPRALWPMLSAMVPMDSEAQSLKTLPLARQRQFLESLPSFLGMKLPTGVWTPMQPASLARMGIKAFIFDETSSVATLQPWTGQALTANPRRHLLIFKSL